MPFGQVVVGPPGSGKSTYCAGLAQFLASTGRSVAVVNLDPANDALAYEAAVDVSDLVNLAAVQEETGLGPNGGLIWAMEYVEANIDWLLDRLRPLTEANHYIVMDCPGQVELFQLHDGFKRVLATLERKLGLRLVAVQLVNVFSKYDLLDQHGDLALSPEFYLEAHGLDRLAESMGSGFPPAFQEMARGICEVVEDFGLLSFQPLAVEDKESMRSLVAIADKANGYYSLQSLGSQMR